LFPNSYIILFWEFYFLPFSVLGTWQTKIFRRVYAPMVEQGVWRVRTNRELRELYDDLGIIADIKKEENGMDWTCGKNGSEDS
jgi:hypothetical protein